MRFLGNVYSILTELHPDCLINVTVHYSPGAPPGVKPFYYTTVTINADLLYSTHNHRSNTSEAVNDLYEIVRAAYNSKEAHKDGG